MTYQLHTDYLIVGAGAVGMAFADSLLTSSQASMIIVDEYHQPGGHWNLAYPFVTLHQPSAYYGVNSLELGSQDLDQVGLNKGLAHLASGAEVSAYFDQVMKQRLLPSGRVQYFPMCRYEIDRHHQNGRFKSIISGNDFEVDVNVSTVDATFLKTSVPATHTPSFTVAPDVHFCPPNDLPFLDFTPTDYVVIGGGKTGIDTCLWLLQQGVDENQICWIVSRDAWLLDRRNAQCSEAFFVDAIGAQAAQFESIANSSSIDDMFDRLEAAGYLQRIDQTVRPTMFHAATVSQMELQELRRLHNVVRMGRVSDIGINKIVLEHGEIATSDSTLHIDCSASAIQNLKIKPIFEKGLITPQTVRPYQPVFSAALAAFVECEYETLDEKNQLCHVVRLPDAAEDYIAMTLAFMMNQKTWSENKTIKQWLYNSRLDGFARLAKDIDRNDKANAEVLQRLRQNAMPAAMKLQQYMTQN